MSFNIRRLIDNIREGIIAYKVIMCPQFSIVRLISNHPTSNLYCSIADDLRKVTNLGAEIYMEIVYFLVICFFLRE